MMIMTEIIIMIIRFGYEDDDHDDEMIITKVI